MKKIIIIILSFLCIITVNNAMQEKHESPENVYLLLREQNPPEDLTIVDYSYLRARLYTSVAYLPTSQLLPEFVDQEKRGLKRKQLFMQYCKIQQQIPNKHPRRMVGR